MNRIGGWLRVLLVFSVLSAAACGWLGAEAYRTEKIEIESSARGVMRFVPADGKLSTEQSSTLSQLRQRQERNLSRQFSIYGMLWVASLLAGAAVIATTRWIVKGFKSQIKL